MEYNYSMDLISRFYNSLLALYEKYFIYFISIAFILFHILLLFYPINSDHYIFNYIGNDILNGGILYQTSVDHKSPTIFIINSIISYFSNNIYVFRIITAFISLFCVYITFKIFGLLNLNDRQKKIYTFIFIIYTSLSQFTSSTNNNENFAFPLLLSIYYLILSKRKYKIILIGIISSIIITFKLNFIILLAPIIILFIHKGKIKWDKLFVYIISFLISITLYLIICKYIYRINFEDLYTYSYLFNKDYLTLTWLGKISSLKVQLIYIFVDLAFILITLYISVRNIIKKDFLTYESLIVYSTLLFSLILGSFYAYYLYIGLFGFIVALISLPKLISNKILLGTICVLLVLHTFFNMSVSVIFATNDYIGSSQVESSAIVDICNKVKLYSNASDKILSVTYGSTIYSICNRKGATRFTSMSHLLIDNKYLDNKYNFDSLFKSDIDKNGIPKIIITEKRDSLYLPNLVYISNLLTNYELLYTNQTYELYILKKI